MNINRFVGIICIRYLSIWLSIWRELKCIWFCIHLKAWDNFDQQMIQHWILVIVHLFLLFILRYSRIYSLYFLNNNTTYMKMNKLPVRILIPAFFCNCWSIHFLYIIVSGDVWVFVIQLLNSCIYDKPFQCLFTITISARLWKALQNYTIRLTIDTIVYITEYDVMKFCIM